MSRTRPESGGRRGRGQGLGQGGERSWGLGAGRRHLCRAEEHREVGRGAPTRHRQPLTMPSMSHCAPIMSSLL